MFKGNNRNLRIIIKNIQERLEYHTMDGTRVQIGLWKRLLAYKPLVPRQYL